MKVLHFIMGRASQHTANGVNKIIHGLCKNMVKDGHDIRVIGVSSSSKESFHKVQRDGFEVEVYNSFRGECFKEIKKIAKEVDIVHLNSVWNHYNVVVANYLIKQNIPYVITVHGGLFEDRVKQSKYYTKLFYNKLFQKRIFEKATGVQTNSLEEATAISRYISNDNNFSIPNGIDLDFPEIEDKDLWTNSNKKNDGYIHCGYLGRLSVEKNVDGLIAAIKLLPKNQLDKLRCHLIGPDDNAEAESLKQKVKDANLTEHITFTGAKYGDEKYRTIRDLDFYIHPAFSEGFSIAVIEVLYTTTPCIITRTSNVSYYQDTNSFIMVEPFAKDLCRGIKEMIQRREEWVTIGQNARNLVETKLNWRMISKEMIEAYKTLLADA